MMSRLLLAMACLLISGIGIAAEPDDEEFFSKKWQESEVAMPAPPAEASLQEFEAGVGSSNRFFVDTASLAVTSDGVVRYVLVIQSASGVRSVSFEGMRCETRERRIYAMGRPDGSWVKARNPDWVRIRESAINRQHAALFFDYFCPIGVIVRDADEARGYFKRGGHSLVNSLFK